jgi:hypothetical protein
MPQFGLTLYHKIDAGYSSTLPELFQLLETLKAKYAADIKVISDAQLTAESERELKTSLRDLIPQKRGEIVTSRGNMLPLSAGKNLNLSNTPILLVEKDGRPIDVFPKRTQDRYTDPREGLHQMLEHGIELNQALPSAEENARSRLAINVSTLEPGLELVGEEVHIEAGNIDLLLKDKEDRFLVIELEREARDATIGQVIRLSAGLAQREKVAPDSIRKMIICSRINSHVELAAGSVNIGVRKDPSLFL